MEFSLVFINVKSNFEHDGYNNYWYNNMDSFMFWECANQFSKKFRFVQFMINYYGRKKAEGRFWAFSCRLHFANQDSRFKKWTLATLLKKVSIFIGLQYFIETSRLLYYIIIKK